MNTEEFIKKAKAVHGNKYDYSKVEYINATTKICIICPEHGEFWQVPYSHLKGFRCRKCGAELIWKKRGRITTEEFIRRAKEVHGDKYDYSKVEYVDTKTKICIICPEHGEFWMVPTNHLNGQGCLRCAGKKILNVEDFIKKAREVHGDKYDYSKVKYASTKTKVCIICPEHGEFWQTPDAHIRQKQGCPKCKGTFKSTTKEFIEKARKIHGDKYDYSKVKYVNNNTKVCIICPIHGEFWQTPSDHLLGKGCGKCVGKNMSTEEFIRRAKEIHGDKYDYSKTEYVRHDKKVCIICPIHGEFWQFPSDHINNKSGCPCCNRGLTKEYKFNLLQEFESEYDFRAFLSNNDVNILYVILRNIEPKFEPLKRDIEKALAHSNEVDPIKALRDKYTSDSEDELDEEDEVENETEDFEIATAPSIDLDDDDAIDSMVTTENTKEADAPTIEEVINNTEREIKVINKIEHMLTPEDREYIMNKFLNDKRRIWMAARENRK